MRVVPIIAVLAGALLLAGCPKKPTTAPEARPGTDIAGQADASTRGAAGAGVGDARSLQDAAGAADAAAMDAAMRTIYFDFDSSDIRPEFADVVTTNARRLAGNPALRVRLEGHTDERGSREYNIALGERRAQAVRRGLMLQGVADAQVVTVSYGEERPASDGSDEAAWALNRRVEIVYAK